MTQDKNNRDYDVIIWGGSSYVGRLVAEYFAKNQKGTDLRWAIAGRDVNKMKLTKVEVTEIDRGLESLEILKGDATDKHSLDEITKRTKVRFALKLVLEYRSMILLAYEISKNQAILRFVSKCQND